MDNTDKITVSDRCRVLTSDKIQQGPCSLSDYIRDKRTGLKDGLDLAGKIASCLTELHRTGGVHGGLHPGLVFIPAADAGNFVLAGPFHSKQPSRDIDVGRLAGDGPALAYIAPELTGRFDCPADFKSDLYSLGIILFQLILGRLPFDFKDPSQLIHAHLARDPFAGSDPLPDIPSVVIRMIKKLLSKDPMDRYSNAAGLKADLENCLAQLETFGTIDDFLLDQVNKRRVIRPDQKFYGRKEELRVLEALFDEKSSQNTQMVLVKGGSGIGKTSFVRKFCDRVKGRHPGEVIVIFGKYDQVRQHVPYLALAQALKAFIRQALTLDQPSLNRLKKRILTAVGQNGQLISDMIPELAWIIGPQPEVLDLDILESRNRFFNTFARFLSAIAGTGQQIILFLDDLQWVDAQSLLLLKKVLETPIPGLFLMGAYRKQEVGPSHLLATFINEAAESGVLLNSLSLGPLGKESVTRMVAGSSDTDMAAAASVAGIILGQSLGNPFYIKEYIRSLLYLNHLKYDLNLNNWEWDIKGIRELRQNTSVQELTHNRIAHVDTALAKVLKKAACIGNAFDCEDLALVCDVSAPVIDTVLNKAVQHELVVAAKTGQKGKPKRFQFIHDDIQLAFYHLIPGEKRAAEHYRIGKIFYDAIDTGIKGTRFMDAVAQMNLGKSAAGRALEQLSLAKINLIAARAAKKTAAYHTALSYVTTGIDIVGDRAWQDHYNLTLHLHNEAAETAFLCLKFSLAQDLADQVTAHAQTALDKMKVYEIQLLLRMAENAIPKALSTVLDALGELGERLPAKPHPGHVLAAYLKTRVGMIAKTAASLEHLPAMAEPRALAAVQLYSQALTVTYVTAPMLTPIFMFNAFALIMKYGNPPLAPFIYAMYGMMLCCVIKDIPSGLSYARLAATLLKKDEFKAQAARTRLIINCYIHPWQHHPKNDLAQLKQGLDSGLAAGDFEFAAFSIHMYCGHSFYCGRPLVEIEPELRRGSREIRVLQHDTIIIANTIFHQTILNLLGESNDPCSLEGEVYSEEKMIPRHQRKNHKNALCIAYLNKLRLCYLFYRFDDALKWASLTQENIDAVMGSSLVPWFYFYDALAHLAAYEKKDKKKQKKILSRISASLKKMKKWADIVPVNHLHTFLLVKAEKARAKGQAAQATFLYNQAIDAAKRHDYIHEQALAWELAAKFYEEQGRTALAETYLYQALDCYEKWGAAAKIAQLKKHYSHLLDNAGQHRSSLNPAGHHLGSSLDLAALTRACEAIAKQTQIPGLMDKLMTIVLENAGARKGALMFKANGAWQVEARVDVEDSKEFYPLPFHKCTDLPHAVIRYARRTGRDIVLSHAAADPRYDRDPYVQKEKLKSALCIPLFHQEQTCGILYLENNSITGVFTPQKMEVLKSVARILANARARNLAEEQIIDYQDRLRALSSKLLLVEEKERRRMAVALHDHIGHGLSGLAMEFEKLKQESPGPDPDRFNTIQSIIDESVKATHTLTFELSPPILYDLGLGSALDWLAEKTTTRHGIQVSFMDTGTMADIDESSAVLIFQSVRELLFNMVKHARAQQAYVLMKTDKSDLVVVVKDNGKGFDPSALDALGHAKGGFGLFSIQERLGSRGGYMHIDSALGKGTQITLVHPLEPGLESGPEPENILDTEPAQVP